MSSAGAGTSLRIEAVRRRSPADCLAGGGDMGALMRATDWTSTPLGAVGGWPQSLRTSVSICLGTSFPMMIAWGPQLHMLYNDSYLPVLGTKKHPRALGQPLLECFEEIRDLIGPMFRGVMESGEAVGAEDMMFPIERHGYPEETYFVFSYSPIRDESGHVGGVLTTCTETTQRVIGERRLRTLRALAEGAAHAVAVTDAFERAAATLDPADTPFSLFYLVDPSASRARLVATSGIAPNAPASPSVIELREETTAAWPLQACAKARTPQLVTGLTEKFGPLPAGPWPEPTTQALVLPIARPGYQHPYGFLVAGISPRRALDDEYSGYLELVADHTATAAANARAREEERRRSEALAEIDRVKTTFFSNVSHEFRTPLTLMLGPLEDLLAGTHGKLTDAVRAELDLTHRSSLRLLRLVDSLLDFAQIEAGRLRAVYEPVDLATLTADIASSFRSAIERAGLRFTVDCPPLSAPAYVDREMWEKIVLNLLSNALKFTFEGEIKIELRSNGELVELEVRDTGSGIPRAQLPNLFRRFHRIQGARARTHEGSGIGLALVQDLLRLHGGEIRCHSELDHGTSFTATIRTGSAHLPTDQVTSERKLARAVRAEAFVEEALRWLTDSSQDDAMAEDPARAQKAGQEPTCRRILVVDDNADMRDYLQRILSEHWQVETVENGGRALEAALARPPALVLTDVMMPVLDGFGLLRELKSDPRTRTIPVVILSARAGEESRIEGLDAGADDYLIKPFSARELVARISSQLSLAETRRVVEEQRATLYALFEQIPASVSVMRSSDFVYEMVNQHFLAFVGRRDDELLGKPALEVFPELKGQGFEQMLLGVMHSGEPFVGSEVPLRLDLDRNGARETSYWNLALIALADEQGRTERVMSFAYDVTDQVRARRKLEAIAAELEQTVASRDETVAQLDTIVASVPVGLAFFDRELRYLRINDHMARVNDVPIEQTLGRSVVEILPPELAAVAEQNVRRVFETRAQVGPFEISTPAPGMPADPRHWLLTYYPVKDRAGEVCQVGAAVVDITARRDAELERGELLQREQVARREADLQRQHLHSLFMQAPTPICILRGARHVIDLANTQACELWGRRQQDVIGRPLFEALPEIESQLFKDLLAGVLDSGEPYVGKEVPTALRGSGEARTRYLNFVYAPMRNSDNQVDGVLVIAFDVTDEVRAREEMSRTVHFNEMFAGVLAHDLRNPLGAILTAAHLLTLRSTDEHVLSLASRILSSGERMSRMIAQLLDVTRIRLGGGLSLQRQRVDLAEITQRVASEVEQSEGRKLEIQTLGDACGEWDPDRIGQLISNLAGNAAQHGEPTTAPCIRLDARQRDAVLLSFENRGRIPDELVPDLFDPFRGMDNPRGGAQGLGLGLFISKQIALAHGGNLDVVVGADTTRFTVVLPRGAEPANATNGVSPSSESGRGLFADGSDASA